jgi:hypothetical protein
MNLYLITGKFDFPSDIRTCSFLMILAVFDIGMLEAFLLRYTGDVLLTAGTPLLDPTSIS